MRWNATRIQAPPRPSAPFEEDGVIRSRPKVEVGMGIREH